MHYHYAPKTLWHTGGGKGTRIALVKFQMRAGSSGALMPAAGLHLLCPGALIYKLAEAEDRAWGSIPDIDG